MARQLMSKLGILLVGNFLSSHTDTRSVGEELSLRLFAKGWKTIETPHQATRLYRLVDMLFSVIFHRKEYQIAYVEVYSGAAFLWAEMACWLLGVLRKPNVLTLHGGNLPIFASHWPGRVRRLLKGANAVTAPSRYLQEKMFPYRDDILLIPNPSEIKKYPFRLRSTPTLTLVWLRAFHNIYNPQMAPLVINKLRISFPDISLTMIGPDKGDGTLQETQTLIQKLDLQANIEIVPGISKSDVPEYLERADIFINTTNIDNTPVSVLEAMVCGLCVVSTNVGGIPYLLDDGIDALLVPSDDADAMAAAVRRILTEPGLAARISENARKKVEQYDWCVIFPQWEALFAKVINWRETKRQP